MMTCPECGGDLEVKYGRDYKNKEIAYKRVRECRECGFAVTTIERPIQLYEKNQKIVDKLTAIVVEEF